MPCVLIVQPGKAVIRLHDGKRRLRIQSVLPVRDVLNGIPGLGSRHGAALEQLGMQVRSREARADPIRDLSVDLEFPTLDHRVTEVVLYAKSALQEMPFLNVS